jgi:hypothetical protein
MGLLYSNLLNITDLKTNLLIALRECGTKRLAIN